MNCLASVPYVVAVATSLVAGVIDVWIFKVHNALSLPLMAAGLMYHVLVSGLDGLLASALGLAVGFGVLLVLYALGGMGAGDVKFAGAIGAWLGVPLIFTVLLASFVAAGVYSAGLLVWRRVRRDRPNARPESCKEVAGDEVLRGPDRLVAMTNRPDRRLRLVPFTAMLAVGVLAALLWNSWRP